MDIDTIVKEVMKELDGGRGIPISISARHCHLDEKHLKILFGKNASLTEKNKLYQPGEFAANELVTIAGPKDSITKVRVLGPTRSHTQVEISKTDAIKLGLNPPIRMSGDIKQSSPVTIIGPEGSVYLEEGLIIAKSHIHMDDDIAVYYDVKTGDAVSVEVTGERPIVFSDVRIRVSNKYKLEMHIDTDEANAALITNNTIGYLKKGIDG